MIRIRIRKCAPMPHRGQETVIRVLRLWRWPDISRRTRPTRVYPYCARHVSRTYRLCVVCTPRYDACATKVIVRGAHAGPRTLGHPRFFGIAQASPTGRSSAAARPGGLAAKAVHCGPWFCVSSMRCSPQFGALTQSQTEGAAVKLWRETAEYRATAANNSIASHQDRSVKCSNEWKLRPRSREASDKWLIKVRSARRPCGGL